MNNAGDVGCAVRKSHGIATDVGGGYRGGPTTKGPARSGLMCGREGRTRPANKPSLRATLLAGVGPHPMEVLSGTTAKFCRPRLTPRAVSLVSACQTVSTVAHQNPPGNGGTCRMCRARRARGARPSGLWLLLLALLRGRTHGGRKFRGAKKEPGHIPTIIRIRSVQHPRQRVRRPERGVITASRV